jgi:pimeloyl-ACP methyl ester carboxylesterase
MKKVIPLLSAALALGGLCAASAAMAADGYKTTFVWLGPGMPGVLYEPLALGSKADIGVFAMHDNGDYLSPNPANPCAPLATRGYRVLCANSTTSKSGFVSDDDTDKLMLNVKSGVAYLRHLDGVRKVVLFGHSGGGEMMAAYQNIAENGARICQGPEKLVKCSESLDGMPAADGIMLIDAVLGAPVTTLISLDPAVIDEEGGKALNPELDIYNPKNGFNPAGSTYSAEFKTRFFARQGERMNQLIAKALDRLAKIEAGNGRYTDDEPFIIPGAYGLQNKLNSEDLSLQAHTRNAWPLMHADGSVTTEIIHSVRVPRGASSPTPSLARGATMTTVRRFLNTFAIRTTAGYGYDASAISGIDYKSSYADEVDSIEGIARPLLQMGMTGSYEFFASEIARDHAKSADKTLVYVEGALHSFAPCTKCAIAKELPADHYGDTIKILYDYIDKWLGKPGRFLTESGK